MFQLPFTTWDPIVSLWIPILAYAEIHLTLCRWFSYLATPWPEILADAPHRIDPSDHLPVLLFIKDADTRPVRLRRVRVTVCYPDGVTEGRVIPFQDIVIDTRFWHHTVSVPLRRGWSGLVRIQVAFDVAGSFGRRTFYNHAFRGGSRTPLLVQVAADPLPSFPDWVAGDLHTHSNYTDDAVEFGAPLPAMRAAARALGLTFFAVTDHSYDLETRPTGTATPPHPRWDRFREEVAALNQASENAGVWILPGEEVSCGNARGRNVHLLVLNHPDFIPGAGDGARQGLRNTPDLSLSEVLERLGSDAVAYASHPAARPPFLQKWLLRRGYWESADYAHPGLQGVEILNGAYTPDFTAGLIDWRNRLMTGARLGLGAGTDAHGNFNRFRQVAIPLLRLRESLQQRFGWARTYVHVPGTPTPAAILRGLRTGATMITTGPVAQLTITNERGVCCDVGHSIAGRELTVHCQVRSTAEFGKLKRVRIYYGDLGGRRELLYKDIQSLPAYEYTCRFPLLQVVPGYIRVECESQSGATRHRCLTSSVWIAPDRADHESREGHHGDDV